MIRNKIWATLVDVRFKGFILGYLVDSFQKLDRNINIFLALASSGSIAAWAVWQKIPIVWAGIIVVSQVLNAVKPYFPFYKYVKELGAKSIRADGLNIEFEKLWSQLENKRIDEAVAEESYYELRKQMIEIFNFGDETIFKSSDKMEKKANERMKLFFENNYEVVININ